jgi:hypothetical protein
MLALDFVSKIQSHTYLNFDNEPSLMTYKVTENVTFRLRVEDTEPRLLDP